MVLEESERKIDCSLIRGFALPRYFDKVKKNEEDRVVVPKWSEPTNASPETDARLGIAAVSSLALRHHTPTRATTARSSSC
jgi:hypothetical protein